MQENDLFQNLPIEQRAKALKDNAYRTEVQTLKRPFSEQELAGFKDDLSREMIALNELEIQLKEVKDSFKAKMKPYVVAKRDLLKQLKTKYQESEETVYLLDDQQSGIMNIYDAEGKFYQSRKLFPNERQTKLIPLQNTGTE